MAKDKWKSSWDRNNPAEVARDRLRKEIKAGRIIRPAACSLCGYEGQVFGHHWRGYRYPLDVWWVCVSCNTRLKVHDGTQSFDQAKQEVRAASPGRRMTKTDNHNPRQKLELRRHFLRRYHAATPPDVFDCCQGSGLLWNQLREEFPVASYWGVDLKPKPGRLKVDSVRVLQQPGLAANVIDVDTYGEPWKHWKALLPNITRPTTVFLTMGFGMGKAMSVVSIDQLRSVGIWQMPGLSQGRAGKPELHGHQVPNRLLSASAASAASSLLATACGCGIIVKEAQEVDNASSNRAARYIGVHLVPCKQNEPTGA